MYRIRIFWSFLAVIIGFTPGAYAGNNQVIRLMKGDSINLEVEARGTISWQYSEDSLQWAELGGKSGPALAIRASHSAWYRARIVEGSCDPIYSSPTFVEVIDPEARKNIILILADDLGWRDLSCYGSDYYETPHIDRLAAGGIRFSSAYSAHPVCSPTRSSIATGQYPQRLHISAYIPGQERPYAQLQHPADWSKYLPMATTTYAEALKAGAYKTFHAGKWHLGQLSPLYHGFDETEADLYHSEATDDPKNDLRYTRAAMDFIEENRDSLFLVVISHNAVHVPLETTPELEAKYDAKSPGSSGQNNPVMAGMIESLDRSVGLLMDKLEELGLGERSYVIFYSDNGGLSSATSNKPLRRGKSQLYEGGIRVPLIVSGPRLPENRTVSCPVISNDLFPTMLEMAGLDEMPGAHMDGLSLMPLIRGDTDDLPRKSLFFHYPHYQTLPPHSAVRSGSWKLIRHYEDERVELFDLASDPGEEYDLSGIFPERRDELLGLLEAHLEEVGAQLPLPNPGFDPERMAEKTYGTFDPAELEQEEYLKWKNK